MTQAKRVTKSKAFSALRKMDNRRSADAVIVIRGRLDQEGKWDIDWEGAHWMPHLAKELVAPSGLPVGFGIEATKRIAAVTADDTAEAGLGRMGAALGKGLVETIGSSFFEMMKTSPDGDRQD